MNSFRPTTALVLGAAMLLGAQTARAINITIADPNTGSSIGGTPYMETANANPGAGQQGASISQADWWRAGTGAGSEFQEVEPGMIYDSSWDLAAFVSSPGTLGVLSGYNLAQGNAGTTIGDIFVETRPSSTSNTLYPDPNNSLTGYPQFTLNGPGTPGFNFDYALRFNFGASTYSVIKIDANTILENGEYFGNPNPGYNAASQPWRVATSYAGTNHVAGDGTNLGTVVGTFGLNYTNTLSGASAAALLNLPNVTAATPGIGNYQYYAQLTGMDLWLNAAEDPLNPAALFHLTMQCGNDDMYGRQAGGFLTPVPDGSFTISLLGMAFLVLASVRRYVKKS